MQDCSIDLLIQAANYVEKCENKRSRESDHGYASPFRYDEEPLRKKMKSAKKNQNRTSHNELEKNRRAHLRNCLDSLKSIVPLGSDATRHTTLGLLNKAKTLIKDLEIKDNKYETEKDRLAKHNDKLKELLFNLENKYARYRRDSTGSGTFSECSNESDKDEIIDVLETSSSSGDELMMQDMAVGNDPSNGMLMSMPEILIAST